MRNEEGTEIILPQNTGFLLVRVPIYSQELFVKEPFYADLKDTYPPKLA